MPPRENSLDRYRKLSRFGPLLALTVTLVVTGWLIYASGTAVTLEGNIVQRYIAALCNGTLGSTYTKLVYDPLNNPEALKKEILKEQSAYRSGCYGSIQYTRIEDRPPLNVIDKSIIGVTIAPVQIFDSSRRLVDTKDINLVHFQDGTWKVVPQPLVNYLTVSAEFGETTRVIAGEGQGLDVGTGRVMEPARVLQWKGRYLIGVKVIFNATQQWESYELKLRSGGVEAIRLSWADIPASYLEAYHDATGRLESDKTLEARYWFSVSPEDFETSWLELILSVSVRGGQNVLYNTFAVEPGPLEDPIFNPFVSARLDSVEVDTANEQGAHKKRTFHVSLSTRGLKDASFYVTCFGFWLETDDKRSYRPSGCNGDGAYTKKLPPGIEEDWVIEFDYPASSIGDEKRLTYILDWDSVFKEYLLWSK